MCTWWSKTFQEKSFSSAVTIIATAKMLFTHFSSIFIKFIYVTIINLNRKLSSPEKLCQEKLSKFVFYVQISVPKLHSSSSPVDRPSAHWNSSNDFNFNLSICSPEFHLSEKTFLSEPNVNPLRLEWIESEKRENTWKTRAEKRFKYDGLRHHSLSTSLK